MLCNFGGEFGDVTLLRCLIVNMGLIYFYYLHIIMLSILFSHSKFALNLSYIKRLPCNRVQVLPVQHSAMLRTDSINIMIYFQFCVGGCRTSIVCGQV